MIRIGEEDTTKRKKVTITSSQKKNKQKKQKQKGNKTKEKQRTFTSAYFSQGASVESRITIIQSQEPKSAGEKMTRKKNEEISPRFLLVRFSKHAPVPTI